MLEVRIRTCHVHGQFVAKDNKKPAFTLRQALENPSRDVNRIVLPPASFMQEKEKLEKRWPAAVEFIKSRKLNEFFGPKDGAVGVIVLGGLFNGVLRALQQLGLADVYGETSIPIYVLNVAYPIIDDEMAEFCLGKSAVLMVEVAAKAGVAEPVARLTSAAIFAARNECAPMEFPRTVWRLLPRRRRCRTRSEFRKRLQRVAVGFAGADAQGVIDRRHEDLAVADLAGACVRGDDLDRLVREIGGHSDLDS